MTKYTCGKCSSEFYSAGRDEKFLKCPFCGENKAKAMHPDRVEVTNSSNGVILSIPEPVFQALVNSHLLSWDGISESWVYGDENEVAIVQAIHDIKGALGGLRRCV